MDLTDSQKQILKYSVTTIVVIAVIFLTVIIVKHFIHRSPSGPTECVVNCGKKICGPSNCPGKTCGSCSNDETCSSDGTKCQSDPHPHPPVKSCYKQNENPFSDSCSKNTCCDGLKLCLNTSSGEFTCQSSCSNDIQPACLPSTDKGCCGEGKICSSCDNHSKKGEYCVDNDDCDTNLVCKNKVCVDDTPPKPTVCYKQGERPFDDKCVKGTCCSDAPYFCLASDNKSLYCSSDKTCGGTHNIQPLCKNMQDKSCCGEGKACPTCS